METAFKFKESFTDAYTLNRVKELFAAYSLDDAESFTIDERYSNIVFIRNGNRYTLCYDDAYKQDKLVGVTIEPL